MKGAGIAAVIAFPVALILGLVLAITSLSEPAAAACTPSVGAIDPARIPADANAAGYGREQLVNAAAIVNAATALDLPAAAQTLGVQAAIGESSLRNISYGDNAVNPDGSIADSIGLFQQQGSWGTVPQRMDPTTAATLFYQRLAAVTGWEQLEPSIAINRVQINADPFHYVRSRAAAVAVVDYLATLANDGEAARGCSASGDARTVAQGLVVAMNNGSLILLEPRYAKQITDIAAGTAAPGCTVDLRVLQLISLALQRFDTVGVSDLNRRCTGSLVGAGASSTHYINGGGHALDIYSLNGVAARGSTANDLTLLDLLSSIAPPGTRTGQINCRSGQTWPNVSQFVDTCDHLHIDFAYADLPLNIAS